MKNTTAKISQKTHREIIKLKGKIEAETGKTYTMDEIINIAAMRMNLNYEKEKRQLKLLLNG